MTPPSFEVEKPMSPLPQPTVPGLRATWKALTMVLPHAKLWGSTSLLCLLSVFVRVSTLIGARDDCARTMRLSPSNIGMKRSVFTRRDKSGSVAIIWNFLLYVDSFTVASCQLRLLACMRRNEMTAYKHICSRY